MKFIWGRPKQNIIVFKRSEKEQTRQMVCCGQQTPMTAGQSMVHPIQQSILMAVPIAKAVSSVNLIGIPIFLELFYYYLALTPQL